LQVESLPQQQVNLITPEKAKKLITLPYSQVSSDSYVIVYRNDKATGYARGLYLFKGEAAASIPRLLFCHCEERSDAAIYFSSMRF
jgi:hypothetical protein